MGVAVVQDLEEVQDVDGLVGCILLGRVVHGFRVILRHLLDLGLGLLIVHILRTFLFLREILVFLRLRLYSETVLK